SLVAVAGVATTYQTGEVFASDHDDGENDFKERALNLTDHFAFKSSDPATPNDLSMIMYFNPRALPGKNYFLNTNARYEFHVSNVAANTSAASFNENFVFRFEAAAADATGVQAVTLTVLKDGVVQGTPHSGTTTGYADSKAGGASLKIFSDSAGDINFKYFIGMRADSFTFDVVRFFQVRKFLADRFFGGAGGAGDPTAVGRLAPNCKGQGLLAGVLGTPELDGDDVNLFNPPECAPDFTKNYNVTAIVLNVPIADLGGTIFDTWSTVSVAQ
ncbi:MAG: DUF4331 family protein, partial [Deltaproteobacteria bacterium]|nr:DUF4331 family protein [Deltaproteobacteria bacterium]